MTAPSSIGLTGGIGSGKSTVAGLLAACGAHIVDTDEIARSLTAPGGAALGEIVRHFGADLLTSEGALDRAHMRTRVFADAAAKAHLEAILHPMIGAEAARRAALGGDRPTVFDVPLLAESAHWRRRVARIVVVDCPAPVQVRRVMQRSGWHAQDVQRVIAQQADPRHRRSIADAVICNDDTVSLAELAVLVRALWAHWVGGT